MPTHNVEEWKRIAHELLAIIETLYESDAKPTDKTLMRAQNIMIGRYYVNGNGDCDD
jgi:hypothetical protein